MTRHLQPDDFTAALEHSASSEIANHLSACAACRDELASLRDVWEAVATAPVPEPSPLFWDHFSARVREATAAVPVTSESWWSMRRFVWALAPALLIVAAGLVWLGPRAPEMAPDGSVEVARTEDRDLGFEDVASLFQAIPAEDVEVFATAGTATWAMVDELTIEERVAFVRLIEQELEAQQ